MFLARPNTLSLFKTPKLRRYTLALYLVMFGQGFVYYGLALNLGNIGGSLMVNIFIFGAVHLPANVLASIMLGTVKRRVRRRGVKFFFLNFEFLFSARPLLWQS